MSSKIVQGAAAGWLATLPMTLFMELAWRLLPAREKYPLPPRIITNKLRRQWASKRPFRQTGEMALTLLLHFLFGAFTGGIYGIVEDRTPTKGYANSIAKGVVAGLIVWSGSYLGWVPAARIMPPATEQPWRRNLLMIAAHIVWGAVLGLVTTKLRTDGKYVKYIKL
jgi:uncharacterized membrane protein YagU involved in acid resistance